MKYETEFSFGDIVKIWPVIEDFGEKHMNARGMVVGVRDDGLLEVSNMNMPFQGTLCRTLFTEYELEKVR
jgi:hypothetical protein